MDLILKYFYTIYASKKHFFGIYWRPPIFLFTTIIYSYFNSFSPDLSQNEPEICFKAGTCLVYIHRKYMLLEDRFTIMIIVF